MKQVFFFLASYITFLTNYHSTDKPVPYYFRFFVMAALHFWVPIFVLVGVTLDTITNPEISVA